MTGRANKFHPISSMKCIAPTLFLVAVLLLGVGSPADARARDDVMSAAFRCGVIADGHRWLDCIYGSAQPIRAELALPPVTTAQAQLVAAPPSGGRIVDQPTRDEVLSAALRCDTLGADREWLECYYTAAIAMREELGLSSDTRSLPGPGQTVGSTRPSYPLAGAAESNEPNQFGFKERRRTTSGFVSQLATYSFDQFGIFTVTLANGQVWRQVTGDTSYAHWKRPASTYTVAIRKGALGSYSLRVKDGPGLFKVERVS